MIDWSLLTLKMRRHLSYHQIASQAGCNAMHLQRLARSDVAEPRFNTGVRLLDIASDILPAEELLACKERGEI